MDKTGANRQREYRNRKKEEMQHLYRILKKNQKYIKNVDQSDIELLNTLEKRYGE